MVTPYFCVMKLYYLGNYHGMVVNYSAIVLSVTRDKTIPNTGIICNHILAIEKEGTRVNYHGISIKLASRVCTIKT
jgi:hypothetical protein